MFVCFSCWRWSRSWNNRAWPFWCWEGNICCGPPSPGSDTTWTWYNRRLTASLLKTCESPGWHFLTSYCGIQEFCFLKENLLCRACFCLSDRRTTPSSSMLRCTRGTTVGLWAETWCGTTRPACWTEPPDSSSSSGREATRWLWMDLSPLPGGFDLWWERELQRKEGGGQSTIVATNGP